MSERSGGNLRVIFELAGAVAVLVGLVFVGLELRQNTAALSAQAVFELNNIGSDSHRLLAQDGSLEKLVHNGYEDPNSLSEDERRRFVRWISVTFNIFDAAWMYQNK
jgi:hypothetical protein